MADAQPTNIARQEAELRTALAERDAAKQLLDTAIAQAVEDTDRLTAERDAACVIAADWRQELLRANEKLVATAAERDAACREAAEVREELATVLADWNALVLAIGSPTNGGAIGFGLKLRSDHDALRQELKALRAQKPVARVLADGKPHFICRPGTQPPPMTALYAQPITSAEQVLDGCLIGGGNSSSAQATVDEAAERARFEEKFRRLVIGDAAALFMRDSFGAYCEERTVLRWDGWLARAAIPSAAPARATTGDDHGR